MEEVKKQKRGRPPKSPEQKAADAQARAEARALAKEEARAKGLIRPRGRPRIHPEGYKYPNPDPKKYPRKTRAELRADANRVIHERPGSRRYPKEQTRGDGGAPLLNFCAPPDIVEWIKSQALNADISIASWMRWLLNQVKKQSDSRPKGATWIISPEKISSWKDPVVSRGRKVGSPEEGESEEEERRPR